MARENYVGRHRSASTPARGRAVLVPVVVLWAAAAGGLAVRAASDGSADTSASSRLAALGADVAGALGDRSDEGASRSAARAAALMTNLDSVNATASAAEAAGVAAKTGAAINQAVAAKAAADKAAADKAAAAAGVGGGTGGTEAGETKPVAAPAADDHRWVSPFHSYTLTSGYGYRWGKMHAAQDLAAPVGTPVSSISSGTVTFAGWSNSGYGNLVKIQHWDGTESWYAHNSKLLVTTGQKVTPGQQIARSGSTGWSTGPHLHLEIHPAGGAAVSPMPWLAKRGVNL